MAKRRNFADQFKAKVALEALRGNTTVQEIAAIFLEEIHDGFQTRRTIKSWIALYNSDRPHSALDRQTPNDAYSAGIEHLKAA